MTIDPSYNNKSQEELLQIIANMAKQIQFLEEQNAAYRLRQFANKSEKFNNPNQASLFDEAELPKHSEKILEAEEEVTIASYNRKKTPGRKPLPEDLPRVPRVYSFKKTCIDR